MLVVILSAASPERSEGSRLSWLLRPFTLRPVRRAPFDGAHGKQGRQTQGGPFDGAQGRPFDGVRAGSFRVTPTGAATFMGYLQPDRQIRLDS